MTDHMVPQLDQYITGLLELQVQEEEALVALERQARAQRQVVSRIKRAVKELTGDTTPKSRPAGKPKKKSAWNVSDELKQRVRVAIQEAGDTGITQKMVTETAKVSMESARKAIEALREEEIVRKAGRGKGNVTVFKMMPEPVGVSSNGN